MAKKSLVVVINRPGRSGVTSAARMACPYCGKEPMPYAPFCDNCGNDLSALWKSTRPLVRQGYDRQWRQGKPAPGLKDGVQDLKSTLSATARQWKLLPKPRGDKGQSESSATPTSGTMPEPKADLAEIASLRQERELQKNERQRDSRH